MKLLIYVPGLGSTRLNAIQEKIVMRWQKTTTDVHYCKSDWNRTETADEKVSRIVKNLPELKKYSEIRLIGPSAGGALALCLFKALKDKSAISLITINAKLYGTKSHEIRQSIRDANPSLVPVVDQSEQIMNKLNKTEIQNITNISSIIDPLVYPRYHCIPGASRIKQFTIGHLFSIAFALFFYKKTLTRNESSN